MKPSFGRDLTTGSIPRHMISFTIPMLIGSLLQTAYSFVNAIWVGQYLGRSALAAVTVSFPIVFVLYAVGMGLTLATNILVSQNYGAKRFDELEKVTNSSTILIYGLGFSLAVIGYFSSPLVLRLMDTPAEIYGASVSYLQVFMISIPFGFGLFLLRSMLQGIGDSKTALYFQFASVLLATTLDPVLMFGWIGAPKLGLNGTAWASVISQIIVVLALIIYLRAKKAPIAPKWPRFNHIGEVTLKTLRIGVPSAVQQSLVSISMLFVMGIVNGFGEIATAAFGAASRIDQIAFMPAMTFGMAVSTLAGQNLGAGHFDRVREVFKWGCIFSGVITALVSLVSIVFPHGVLSIFINDPVVVDQGVTYLHIVGSCYVFFALMFVSNGIINAAGMTLTSTAISLLSLWIVRVPLAYYLSKRLGSVEGVWYAISISFVVSMSASMAFYFSGRWRRSVVSRKPPTPAGTTDPKVGSDPAQVFGSNVGES